MKKVLLLTTFIAGLLIACNTKTEQKPKIDVNELRNYTFILKKTNEGYPNKNDTILYKQTSAKKVYEKVYEKASSNTIFYSCLVQRVSNNTDIQVLKIEYKLLDEAGTDILPYINYPYKEIDENRIWESVVEIANELYDYCDDSKIVQPNFSKSTILVISQIAL